MASEKHGDDAFLAAVLAKAAAWTAVAESYRAAVAIDGPLGELVHRPSGQAQAGKAHPQKPTDLPVGVFRDKTIKEAIVVYLGAVQRKQTNKQIADGLRAGGIATTSKHFEPTVSTALYRLKADGTILRFNDGWDLAASYPDSLRGRLKKDRKPRAARKAKDRAKAMKRRPKENASGDAKAEPLRAAV